MYVALTDTIYFRQPSSFSIATYAELAVVGTDSVGIEYSYSATKMDSSAVDSLFLIGYLLNWDKDNNAVKQLMDKTRVAVEPLYADSWDEIYARSYGSFMGDSQWSRDEWSKADNRYLSYGIAMETK